MHPLRARLRRHVHADGRGAGARRAGAAAVAARKKRCLLWAGWLAWCRLLCTPLTRLLRVVPCAAALRSPERKRPVWTICPPACPPHLPAPSSLHSPPQILASTSERMKNFAVIYLVDISAVSGCCWVLMLRCPHSSAAVLQCLASPGAHHRARLGAAGCYRVLAAAGCCRQGREDGPGPRALPYGSLRSPSPTSCGRYCHHAHWYITLYCSLTHGIAGARL